MTAWTISAQPNFVPTASVISSNSNSASGVTDEGGTFGDFKGTGSSSAVYQATSYTDSLSNTFETQSYSDAGAGGESLYGSNGLEEETTFSDSYSSRSLVTQSWDGRRTQSYEDDSTTISETAVSQTIQTTIDTTTQTTSSGFGAASTTTTTTIARGTTVSQSGQSFLTTTTSESTTDALGGSSAPVTFTATTTRTASTTMWSMTSGGGTWLPTIHTNTAVLLGNSVLWSVTATPNGHFTNGAVSVSGSAIVSTSPILSSGRVVTVTNTTFTATSFEVVSGTQQANTTIAATTQVVSYVGNSIPLTPVTGTRTRRQSTTTSQVTASSALSASSHLPTRSTIVAATKTFAVAANAPLTIAATTGTRTTTTTANYSTAGSASGSATGSQTETFLPPSSGTEESSSTLGVTWQESQRTGYNLALAGGQSSVGTYYLAGWAAASSFQEVGALVAANVGIATLPVVVGNQTVRAFVGSATFLHNQQTMSASADGAKVTVTSNNGTNFVTTSASLNPQGEPVTSVFSGNATAPGGKAGLGDIVKVLLPGAYNTSNSLGASGSVLNNDIEEMTVGATVAKTAAFPRPHYLGSLGDIFSFVTERNYTAI